MEVRRVTIGGSELSVKRLSSGEYDIETSEGIVIEVRRLKAWESVWTAGPFGSHHITPMTSALIRAMFGAELDDSWIETPFIPPEVEDALLDYLRDALRWGEWMSVRGRGTRVLATTSPDPALSLVVGATPLRWRGPGLTIAPAYFPSAEPPVGEVVVPYGARALAFGDVVYVLGALNSETFAEVDAKRLTVEGAGFFLYEGENPLHRWLRELAVVAASSVVDADRDVVIVEEVGDGVIGFSGVVGPISLSRGAMSAMAEWAVLLEDGVAVFALPVARMLSLMGAGEVRPVKLARLNSPAPSALVDEYVEVGGGYVGWIRGEDELYVVASADYRSVCARVTSPEDYAELVGDMERAGDGLASLLAGAAAHALLRIHSVDHAAGSRSH